jgi:hypothetical protein
MHSERAKQTAVTGRCTQSSRDNSDNSPGRRTPYPSSHIYSVVPYLHTQRSPPLLTARPSYRLSVSPHLRTRSQQAWKLLLHNHIASARPRLPPGPAARLLPHFRLQSWLALCDSCAASSHCGDSRPALQVEFHLGRIVSSTAPDSCPINTRTGRPSRNRYLRTLLYRRSLLRPSRH